MAFGLFRLFPEHQNLQLQGTDVCDELNDIYNWAHIFDFGFGLDDVFPPDDLGSRPGALC